jgi:hypothetical protein
MGKYGPCINAELAVLAIVLATGLPGLEQALEMIPASVRLGLTFWKTLHQLFITQPQAPEILNQLQLRFSPPRLLKIVVPVNRVFRQWSARWLRPLAVSSQGEQVGTQVLQDLHPFGFGEV